MTDDLKQYVYLMRLDKPIGILLLMWPTLWALWLASNGMPHLGVLAIFIAGVVLMRSAGCIINDFADRKLDRQVTRTRERPLATGKIPTTKALILFGVLTLIAFSLVLFLNSLVVLLAVGGLAFTVIYPYLKRITHLPQMGLGIAFSWGIPMAFAAVKNTVPPDAWLLFFTAILWPISYDTMYAMADREEDLRAGTKSTAILFGSKDTLMVALFQVMFLSLMGWLGLYFDLNLYYYLSLLVAESFFAYQHYLIKDNVPARCLRGFLNNNWVGLSIFLGIVLGLR
jgi:4-hydroxybenzoate polyprenyltransferase